MKILTIITVLFAFSAFGQNKLNSTNDSELEIDSSVFAIIPFDTTSNYIFKAGIPTMLSNKDLSQIESLIQKFISDYNPNLQKQYEQIKKEHPDYKLDKKDFILDLKRYKRQYVPIINENGEKEIWVNCLCQTYMDWRKLILEISDGGNCYFNLKVNLTANKYYDWYVNGDA